LRRRIARFLAGAAVLSHQELFSSFLILPQKLEFEFTAELNDKHCIDISALVPDEFEADTETFSQRMPQVLRNPDC
jgi:hypothetical protein